MTDLRDSVLPICHSYKIDDLDLKDGLIYPNYQGYSLLNLPSTVCAWLGAPGIGEQPFGDRIRSKLPGRFQHVILILIDGLGLDTFTRILEEEQSSSTAFWNDFVSQGLLAPMTSITPSTTAAALTTLWTGVPAARHGMMGYEMWLKEYSMIINAITHAPMAYSGDVGSLRKAGFQPDTFLTAPLFGPHLAQNGVRPFAYHHHSIYKSSLSTMLLQGVKSISYSTLSDLWVGLEQNLESSRHERTYSYVYWGSIDEIGHLYGPWDIRASLEFNSFTQQFAGFIQRMRARRYGDTLVLLTADHGMLPAPPDPAYDLQQHPEFLSCLTMLPSGEHRFAYLYIRPGREAQLAQYVEQVWPGQFRLFPSETLLNSGLLGPGDHDPRVPQRIGDWVAVAQGGAYWWWSEKENHLRGQHGGMSQEEMLVPLLALPL